MSEAMAAEYRPSYTKAFKKQTWANRRERKANTIAAIKSAREREDFRSANEARQELRRIIAADQRFRKMLDGLKPEKRCRAALSEEDKAMMMEIVSEVAVKAGMSTDMVMSHCRTARIVHAKHVAIAGIWLRMPNLSQVKIGQFFGMHHTSVLHVLRKMGLK